MEGERVELRWSEWVVGGGGRRRGGGRAERGEGGRRRCTCVVDGASGW